MSGKRAKKIRQEQADAAAATRAVEHAAEAQRERLEQQRLVGAAARYGVTVGVIKHEQFQAYEAGIALDDWMARKRAQKLQATASIAVSGGARSGDIERRGETAEQRRKHRAEATHRRPRKSGQRRERSIIIRVNEREYETLSRKAHQQQLSLAAYMVESGLNRRIRNPKRGPTPPPTFVPVRADVVLMPVIDVERAERVETSAASDDEYGQLALLPASWRG